MTVGIYIENCVDVQLIGNKFHNVDQPVVARRVKNLRATGNTATYGYEQSQTFGTEGYKLNPLAEALRRIYRE